MSQGSEDKKLLTIVIPVYKVESYIHKCLDSIMVSSSQMRALEVIVVNDGTPDCSAEIAREYAGKYPDTITVIDKENGGHGSAWNVGLKAATGAYLRFLDSDDWLSNLPEFISCLKTIDADMVFTHLNKYYEDTKKSEADRITGIEYLRIYDTSIFPNVKIDDSYKYALYNFWYCTYRTEMLRKEHPLFEEGVSYDDAILQLAPILLGRTMVFLDMPLYNYRLGRSGQSVEKIIMKKRINDYIPVGKGLLRIAEKYPDIELFQKKQRDEMLSQWMKFRMGDASFLPFKEYRDFMSVWFPDIKNVPYIKKSPKMRIFQSLPTFFSWLIFQVFNSIVP